MTTNINQQLTGKTIKEIYFNEFYLKFVTNDGIFCYKTEGDCCSISVFYDFYGVKNLLNNGKVLKVEEVELEVSDIVKKTQLMKDEKDEDEDIQVYGFRIITESEEFGEVSSVFSFRNYSNGYYGGWIEACKNIEVMPRIYDDVPLT